MGRHGSAGGRALRSSGNNDLPCEPHVTLKSRREKKKARDDSDEMLRTSAVIGVARPVTLYSIPLSETVTYRHYPNTQWGAPVLRVYQFPRTRLSPVWNIYRSLRCMRSRSIEISCSDHSYLLVRPILCLGIDEQTGKDSVLHRLRKCGFLTQPKMFQHPR